LLQEEWEFAIPDQAAAVRALCGERQSMLQAIARASATHVELEWNPCDEGLCAGRFHLGSGPF
jgi:hypothetical protein